MKDHVRRFLIPFAPAFLVIAAASFALGQTPTQRATSSIDGRRENMNQSMDNDRIRAAQELDKKNQKTKEERQKLVNDSFRDLQLVHNEIVAFLTGPNTADEKTARGLATRARVAATALRDNLALPGERKASKSKKEEAPLVVNDGLRKVNDLIKSFVKNINLSPNDPGAGAQARRDLDEIVALSSKIAPENEKIATP
jgi:hypothetical protein